MPQLTTGEKVGPKHVSDADVFRTNNGYLDLIDWDDPADPIRQMIIPREDEFASVTTMRMGSIIGVRGRIDFLIAVKIDSAAR